MVKMKILNRFQQKNSFTSALFIGLAAILLVAGLTMVNRPPEITHAQFADLTAAQTQYSNISGSALDACGLCHTATFGFNDYGLAYASAGKDFAAIEGQDSDGDGFTNIEEILALTFPGDAASKPAQPTPTPPPPGNVVLKLNGPSSVTVGQEFQIDVVAQGADANSAIYGAQFELYFEADDLEVVDGSLQPGSAMRPYVIAFSEIDNTGGTAELIYSRQGNVPGLTGEVVLASLRLRATTATAGAILSLPVEEMVLGTKDADSIPVSSATGLTLAITEPGSNKATLSGQVSLPGKTEQSDAVVSLQGSDFSANTDSTGHFSMAEVDPGAYTIEAAAPGYLKAVCSNKTVSAPATELAAVSLISGDLNGDDLIDITDATTIGVDFGNNNLRSDLNDDGAINVLDLIMVANNFGLSGPSPWSC